MITALGVAAAGGVGASCRMAVDTAVRRRTGRREGPSVALGTLTVNVIGSLVLGLVVGAVVFHGAPTAWRSLLGVGFCGGFTTWSTLVWEVYATAARDRRDAAMIALVGVVVPLLAGGAGLAIAYAG